MARAIRSKIAANSGSSTRAIDGAWSSVAIVGLRFDRDAGSDRPRLLEIRLRDTVQLLRDPTTFGQDRPAVVLPVGGDDAGHQHIATAGRLRQHDVELDVVHRLDDVEQHAEHAEGELLSRSPDALAHDAAPRPRPGAGSPPPHDGLQIHTCRSGSAARCARACSSAYE